METAAARSSWPHLSTSPEDSGYSPVGVADPLLPVLFLLLCRFSFSILHLSRDGAKRMGRGTGKFLALVLSLSLACWAQVPLRPLAHVPAHSRHSASASSSFLISAGN